MNRAHPLPDALAGRAFHFREARDLGLTASRLRAGDLDTPTRGVRCVRRPNPETDAGGAGRSRAETASERQIRLRAELIDRAERFLPALTDAQFYSHGTALALLGAPLPFRSAGAWELHVSARRPAGQPRRSGVVGHRLQQRDPARWRARGLPIEHPARVWRQAGEEWELDDLIAAADFLVCPRHRLIALGDLRREIADAGDVRGHLLARALDEVRVGAETAEETRLRLLTTRAGLPEPELNHRLHDRNGRFIARIDLAYPRYRVAAEHDGRTHAVDKQQFAKDADRWDAIRAAGWQHVRVLGHHMRPDPQVAVARVAVALHDAGWRPGQS